MISVVKRPFKAGGKFYPAGTVVEPAGVTLYRNRLGEGKIIEVDERNVDSVAHYLEARYGVTDALNKLTEAIGGKPKLPELKLTATAEPTTQEQHTEPQTVDEPVTNPSVE